MSAIEERLKTLGIELPQPPPPGGNYVGAVRYGKLVYLSGHGPMQTDGTYLSGKGRIRFRRKRLTRPHVSPD